MNGVFKYTFGVLERFTPTSIFADKLHNKNNEELGTIISSPIKEADIAFKTTARGCCLEISLDSQEQLFGFGLQLKSVNQNSKKKTVRVNSDPITDTGDSHAPVPMYVSNKGYAVYVDTARYATFYCGSHTKINSAGTGPGIKAADNTDSLYAARESAGQKYMIIDIPVAKGVDVYVFAGPTMIDAVKRYNMFSGGGHTPPMWGLGIWYRTYINATQDTVLNQSQEFRNEKIPCDVFGLEPYWQSHSYPCTYDWNRQDFREPDRLIADLRNNGYHINLWEHAFIHQASPIYDDMKPYIADFQTMDGIVPDFSMKKPKEIFGDYHDKQFVSKGISGFKLDECDNSDFIVSPWSYPEISEFPSGMDGEQMHSVMGMLYQQTFMPVFEKKNLRTYGGVRSSGAFAADLPFVLYSDLYDHKDFIRGIVNSGFCGLSWTPEVRQCNSVEDLMRRLETVIFSPMALVNAWMIPHPPWKQFDEQKNKDHIFMDDYHEVTDRVKKLFNLRMSLLPYLYDAFYKYEMTGKPPFRAIVMDYPDDPNTFNIDNQYMMGDSLLIAPLVEGEYSRRIYLPAGNWFDFFTGEIYKGGRTIDFAADIDTIPVFIKENSIIALSQPVTNITEETVFEIYPKKFGTGDATCTLIEDDGITYDYRNGKLNVITITWKKDEKPVFKRNGSFNKVKYIINL